MRKLVLILNLLLLISCGGFEQPPQPALQITLKQKTAQASVPTRDAKVEASAAQLIQKIVGREGNPVKNVIFSGNKVTFLAPMGEDTVVIFHFANGETGTYGVKPTRRTIKFNAFPNQSIRWLE